MHIGSVCGYKTVSFWLLLLLSFQFDCWYYFWGCFSFFMRCKIFRSGAGRGGREEEAVLWWQYFSFESIADNQTDREIQTRNDDNWWRYHRVMWRNDPINSQPGRKMSNRNKNKSVNFMMDSMNLSLLRRSVDRCEDRPRPEPPEPKRAPRQSSPAPPPPPPPPPPPSPVPHHSL